MFFMAFVSAYVVRKDMPNSAWIPLELPRILWLNTLILIASSFTLTRARKLFIAKDQEGFRHWWATTTFLGVLFVAGQIMAWRQLGGGRERSWRRIRAAASFTFSPAAHGLHLLGGVLALLLHPVPARRRK